MHGIFLSRPTYYNILREKKSKIVRVAARSIWAEMAHMFIGPYARSQSSEASSNVCTMKRFHAWCCFRVHRQWLHCCSLLAYTVAWLRINSRVRHAPLYPECIPRFTLSTYHLYSLSDPPYHMYTDSSSSRIYLEIQLLYPHWL